MVDLNAELIIRSTGIGRRLWYGPRHAGGDPWSLIASSRMAAWLKMWHRKPSRQDALVAVSAGVDDSCGKHISASAFVKGGGHGHGEPPAQGAQLQAQGVSWDCGSKCVRRGGAGRSRRGHSSAGCGGMGAAGARRSRSMGCGDGVAGR